jgi:hypothetical protein
MGLKRKRSLQFLSPESTTCTASQRDPSFSPTPVCRPTCFSLPQMDMEVQAHVNGNVLEITPRHLDSRTRKRFRDGRPSPEQIFGELPISSLEMIRFHMASLTPLAFNSWYPFSTEKTLHLLYNSARNPTYHDQVSPPISPKSPLSQKFLAARSPHVQPPPPELCSPQPTLHSFWLLPPARSQASTLSTHPSPLPSQSCQDCDAPLIVVDENAMDIDDALSGEFGCLSCGRLVCDRCAVLGDRTCLQCATR